MRSVMAVLLAVAGVAVLVGAGGGSRPLTKSEYVKQVTTIRNGVTTSIGGLTSATTPAVAAGALTKVRVQLQVAQKQLRSITPPPGIKAQHTQLTTAVGKLADELGPLVAKVRTGGLQALASVGSLKGLRDLQAANTALTKAGYNIKFTLGL